MTPLRKEDDPGHAVSVAFSPRTHKSYPCCCLRILLVTFTSPRTRSWASELQRLSFCYLVQDRNLSPASCRMYLNRCSVSVPKGHLDVAIHFVSTLVVPSDRSASRSC